jgi:hypothetical protein
MLQVRGGNNFNAILKSKGWGRSMGNFFQGGGGTVVVMAVAAFTDRECLNDSSMPSG